MENKFTIAYIGKRLQGNTMYHAYRQVEKANGMWVPSTQNTKILCFSKRLAIHVIGHVIACERTETGVKGPYSILGYAKENWIEKWSIEEVTNVAKHEEIKAAKVKPDAHVDSLIQAVKDNTMTPSDRRRVAMYIYNRLVF